MSAKPCRIPGPEQDVPPWPELQRRFEAAVLDAYCASVPVRRRPRNWRRAVARGAKLMASRSHLIDCGRTLPGIYPFGPGDTVRVVCSLGGTPAKITGQVLWGPAVLFGKVWVRVAGIGMIPAAHVKCATDF